MKQYPEVIQSRRSQVHPAAIAVLAIATLSACQLTQESPVRFSVTVPEPDRVAVTIELTQYFGLGVGGAFDLMGYGTLQLVPEAPSRNQHFALIAELDAGAFERGNWVDFRETRRLPTGASLPSWFAGPVVDVSVPEADLPEVAWNFYLGTRGRYYLGAAASISALNGVNIPSLSLDYTFYDRQGRLILGFQFFSPGVDSQGVRRPGGILVGADLTPFIPDSYKRITREESESVLADARLSGQDSARYFLDASATEKVFKSYLKASRKLPVREGVVSLIKR